MVLTPWEAESRLTVSEFHWGEIMRVPALAACLLLLFSSSVLRAQSTSASLTGHVTDPRDYVQTKIETGMAGVL